MQQQSGIDIQDSLKGHFLIAMPDMVDFNFYQTVTCLSEHNASGAVGVVINRVLPSVSAKAIFKELDLAYTIDADAVPVHIGGPVHENEIFILHGPPFAWQGCLKITPTLAMSNTIDLLTAIARGEGPAAFIIALGCAGWAGGQLEQEMADNAWLTCPLNEKIVFESPVEDRWAAAVRMLGIDPGLLSHTPGHA